MARIDDYQQAHALAASKLANDDFDDIIRRSGLARYDSSTLRVTFLDRIYHIHYPDFFFSDIRDDATQVPLQEQVLILHYLQGCRPLLQGRWVAYREIPGAGFYFGAFVKRAVEPLKKVFGQNVTALALAVDKLNGSRLETGSAAFRIDVLPYAPLQLIIHEGDEEFPAEANILFDAAVGDYLSPEDAAWLASLTVYRLMGLAR